MRLRDWAKRGALALLRGYKWAISPMLPPSCRYVPTCSEYAVEAIELHGVVKGSALGAWRLLRCHPFAKGGVDPVPLPKDGDRHDCGTHSAQEVFRGASLRRTGGGARPYASTCTHTH